MNTVWSIRRRLISRLVLATLAAALLTSLIVAWHYGRDLADLRQRKVLERAEHIAQAVTGPAAGVAPGAEDIAAFGAFFRTHPDAYGWRLVDASGESFAQSGFDWSGFEIPVSGPDEWTHSPADSVWIAGKKYGCGGARCEVQVIATSDPAHQLGWLILEEVAIHVLFPVLLCALLILVAARRVTGATLAPLSRVAAHARAIRELKDVTPIRLEAAPIEISELAGALNETLGRLQAAMDREQAFLLDAAHSLRTPLAALQVRLDLDGGKLDPAALRSDMRELVRLCGQLLNSAHADRLVLNPNRRIDADALIMRVVGRLDGLARASGVELSYENHSARSLVTGDEDAISIALTNLIENAIQHTRPGSEVLVCLSNDPLRIEVTDQGPGIEDARFGAVQARFARGEGAQAGGAGLGLAIVKRIMQIHGGSLELRRAERGGLTASLVFA